MCRDAAEKKRLAGLGLWEGDFYRFTRRLAYRSVTRYIQQRCQWSASPWDASMRGSVILAPTHASHLDFWSVLMALPEPLLRLTYIAAATDHFYQRPGWALATRLVSYHNFAFNRLARGTSEFKRLEQVVEAGYTLLVFPQGSRMRQGNWVPYKPWLARLAIATGVPVLPIGIAGTERVLPPGTCRPRPARIRVALGKPMPPPEWPRGKNPGWVRREDLDHYAFSINQAAFALWQQAHATESV